MLLLASVLLVALFTAALRYIWRTPVRVEPGNYQLVTPEAFRCEVAVHRADGAYTLNGWACLAGERIEWADCWVVLYAGAQDAYYRLPTMAGMLTEEATEAIGDGLTYGRAGLSAVVALSKLSVELEDSELCFLYRSNGHGYIVHTGLSALGGGGV
jgi:hypothetical protein